MKVTYESNNSGGDWWLKDEHWKALEVAGWKVKWFATDPDKTWVDKCGTRWLGALAKEATRQGLSLRMAAREWEEVTGLSSAETGCPCCGQPHSFTEYDADGRSTDYGPKTSYESSWD